MSTAPLVKIRSLSKLGDYLKHYKWACAGATIAIMIAAGTLLSMGQGMRILVDQGFVEDNPDLLNQAIVILMGLILLMALASFFRHFSIHWVGERIVADIRKDLFSHMLKLSPEFYESQKVGNVLSHMSTDTAIVETVVGTSIPIAMRNSLILVGGLTLLIYTSAKLTLVMLLVVPVLMVIMVFLGKRVKALSRNTQDKVADLSGHVEESLNAIATLQAYVRESYDLSRFSTKVDEAFSTAMKRIFFRAIMSACIILCVFTGIAVMLWLGAQDVMNGTLSGGELASFVFYAVIVAAAVGALSDVAGELLRASGAIQRVFELMDTPPAIQSPPNPQELPATVKGQVTFDEVSFFYPSKPDQLALRDFSLDIKAGETVAIVGPSGAGKTTLFQLLLRFYKPQNGRISIDGVPIESLSLEDSRALIGIVPQDPYIFSDNVTHNISYARPSASEKEVLAAARAANAHEFIEKLPQKYDTFLGQKGVRISGGQKQRLAIARALLADPKILLLDEATSALDAENETLIQEALTLLMKHRTTLVVTHRLSTIKNADRIIVMDNGQILEEGDHDTLMASDESKRESKTGGLYKKLVMLQNKEAA